MKRYHVSRAKVFQILAVLPNLDITYASSLFIEMWLSTEEHKTITYKFGESSCWEA